MQRQSDGEQRQHHDRDWFAHELQQFHQYLVERDLHRRRNLRVHRRQYCKQCGEPDADRNFGKILNGTTNGLANFANNTGTFTLSGNANLTSGSANFSNTGTAVVSHGSTLTVGGTNHSYNQSGGKTTVDGTVSTTGSGQVNILSLPRIKR